MESTRLLTFFLIAVTAVYTITAVYTLLNRSFRERRELELTIYLFAAALWTVVMVAPLLNGTSPDPLPLLVSPILTLLFYFLSRSFLYLKTNGRLFLIYTGAMGFWLAGLLLLEKTAVFPSSAFVFMLHGTWITLLAGTAVFTSRIYRQYARQPLHRNRILYWLWLLLFTAAAISLAVMGQTVLGSSLLLVTGLLATYVMFSSQLIDVRRLRRRLTGHFLAVILLVGLYLIGMFIAVTLQAQIILAGAAMALLVLLLFNPLLNSLQSITDNLTAGIDYDPRQTMRAYSLRISSVMELNELEVTMMHLIHEAMSSRYGTLFLVEADEGHILPIYELISVQGFGGERLSFGSFEIDSPVAAWLAEERRPLAQYDIDMLPRFSNISEMERDWLAGLGIEVYVPIHHDERWVGLLGLGPKQSDDRYFENDLMLLATLADQTAVALENARLLTDLVKLNRDLQETKETLIVANEQLNASDKLKSAFIGVITHEMRTPFANVNFSLELMRQLGMDNFSSPQHEAFDNVSQGVEVASMMVDNLITYASYLSKQRPLRPQPFDFTAMVEEQLQTLRLLASNRNITLDLLQPDKLPVVADHELLADAIYHLVHNAVKFTGDDGHIWVRTWSDADGVHFEVQDNGIGIPAAELDNLWRDFSQMADPLQRGVEGLGLGLPLVKHIVTEHGGMIQAHSEEGAGSVFGFTIPVR